MKKNYDGRSFDEIQTTIELLELSGVKDRDSETEEKVEQARKEIRFERLKRARKEYEASSIPPEEWPPALQGRTLNEWEIKTVKALGLPVPEHLKVVCKDFLKQEAEKETINMGTITGTTKNE